MRTTIRAAVAALLLGLPAPGSAQNVGTETGFERVTPGWVFTPAMAVGVSFDDNPVLASLGNPSPSDVVSVVRPAGDLTFTQKHTKLALGYHGTLARYQELTEFDNYDQRATAEFRHQPTKRLQLFARNSYMDSQSTDAVQVAGVPFFRTGTRHDELDAGAAIAATKSLEVRSNYRFQWLQFDRPPGVYGALLQGGRSHELMLDTRRQVSQRWRIGGSYNFRHATLGQSAQTFDIQNLEAVGEWQASPTLVIEGGGGLSYLALPGPLGTRTGPAAHVSVRKRTQYAFLTLEAMRSFVPSFSFGGSLRNQEITGAARAPFAGRRGYLQGSLAWRDSEPVLARDLALRAVWTEATVGYALNRWLSVETYYLGTYQDTNVAGGHVDRNRVGVQIVTSHPVRFE